MKTSAKTGIALGIITVAGVYLSISLSEKISDKIEHETTRYKTKKLVNKKFGGNKKLLNIVSELSDTELDYIDQLVNEVKNGRDNISNYEEKVITGAKSFKKNLSEFGFKQ